MNNFHVCSQFVPSHPLLKEPLLVGAGRAGLQRGGWCPVVCLVHGFDALLALDVEQTPILERKENHFRTQSLAVDHLVCQKPVNRKEQGNAALSAQSATPNLYLRFVFPTSHHSSTLHTLTFILFQLHFHLDGIVVLHTQVFCSYTQHMLNSSPRCVGNK